MTQTLMTQFIASTTQTTSLLNSFNPKSKW